MCRCAPLAHTPQVRRIGATQLPPYRLWGWWCDGLSVNDLLLVMLWTGLTVTYLWYLISRKFDTIGSESAWRRCMAGTGTLHQRLRCAHTFLCACPVHPRVAVNLTPPPSPPPPPPQPPPPPRPTAPGSPPPGPREVRACLLLDASGLCLAKTLLATTSSISRWAARCAVCAQRWTL